MRDIICISIHNESTQCTTGNFVSRTLHNFQAALGNDMVSILDEGEIDDNG